MILNFVKTVLDNNGTIKPLIISEELTGGTGLCNPSVYVDGDRILINIRHVLYNLYHSEFDKKFPSRWGPLTYLHPENDQALRTVNYVGELDKNLDIKWISAVDTSKLDTPPQWTFVGLEDGRIVKWDGKYYLTGVRRDTETTGIGRMELSEIDIESTPVREVSRVRLDPPKETYCEKNWMPILDQPFTYVKWSAPTEIVKADLTSKKAEQIALVPHNIPHSRDLRGGSHVIKVGKYWFAITHEVDLWFNEADQKDSIYYHRGVLWNEDWEVVKISDEFKFMNAQIEFCTGIAEIGNDFLITFGYQDNAAYILRGDKQVILNHLFNEHITI